MASAETRTPEDPAAGQFREHVARAIGQGVDVSGVIEEYKRSPEYIQKLEADRNVERFIVSTQPGVQEIMQSYGG